MAGIAMAHPPSVARKTGSLAIYGMSKRTCTHSTYAFTTCPEKCSMTKVPYRAIWLAIIASLQALIAGKIDPVMVCSRSNVAPE